MITNNVTNGSTTDNLNKSLTKNEFLAVKLQSKFLLLKKKQVEHVFNEIQIMTEINNPFILKMRGVAQDNRIMYMYVDYMKHGDLLGALNQFLFTQK